ncbi:Ger(x)C family spore germination protein [Bacillus carboniphilus]|uniref:Ger(X)C family spore germination protein n=1 Tax=Bacillus carboniphilus TaxID=86663 RepID=A0ABY9JXU7_9BACI|nr:Ger(x)C family spore germination protein [Bacillus carboniphilus]WLR43158.1 Ger(x)C family spore germination protein [Bacillus carboniphilus]
MKKICLLLFICLLLLTSCLQVSYIEKVGVVTTFGYDLMEDGERLRGTAVTFQFDPTRQDISQTLFGMANTSKGVREMMNASTSYRLVPGQLQVVIFGQPLAEEGVFELVDTEIRDAKVGTTIHLSVSETSAENILTTKVMGSSINIGEYINRLLEQNIKIENVISSTLHEFLQNYYTVGIDPTMPILSTDKEVIKFVGTALFKKDQFVSSIDSRQSLYLKMLKKPLKSGTIEVVIPREKLKSIITSQGEEEENVNITLANEKSKTKIKVKKQQTPAFELQTSLRARLIEISAELDVSNPKTIPTLQKEISKAVKKQLTETIKIVQESNTDPVGFGIHYKSDTRNVNLTEKEWRSLYEDASFSTSVKLEIDSTGVID